jgi:hypothetical protein
MIEKIPAQWTIEGFMQVYDEQVKTQPTYFAAYNEAEKLHIATFGTPRYKSYDSFRQTRKDYLCKKS